MPRRTALTLQYEWGLVDVERSTLAHALCHTIAQMYPEDKVAFGPVIFSYLIHAMRLVKGDSEVTATLLDVPTVFSDNSTERWRKVGRRASPGGLQKPSTTTPRRK